MHLIDVMASGDGNDGHCYRIDVVIQMIDVMAMVMDIDIGLKL